MERYGKQRLGELLLDSGMITQKFVDHCLDVQQRSGSFKQIGRIMVDELDCLVERLAVVRVVEQRVGTDA